MYYCSNCAREFLEPQRVYETHSLPCPPYEERLVCPFCQSLNFNEKISQHCRCCGVKLKENEREYCSEKCLFIGEKLWAKQRKRLKIAYECSINQKIREIESYNKSHKTNYSYGQYVALIEGRRKKKCVKKRKNT